MAVDETAFDKKVSAANSICIDTSILIYHLEDILPYSILTERLLSLSGKLDIPCVVSALCITELLTGPLKQGKRQAAARAEKFVAGIPNAEIVPITIETARLAANLRASFRLKTPDALLIATAYERRCSLFVTNDRSLERASKKTLEIIVLDDFPSE